MKDTVILKSDVLYPNFKQEENRQQYGYFSIDLR